MLGRNSYPRLLSPGRSLLRICGSLLAPLYAGEGGEPGLKGDLGGEAKSMAQTLPGLHRGFSPLGLHHLAVQLCPVQAQLPVPRGMSLIQGHTSQLDGWKSHLCSLAQFYQWMFYGKCFYLHLSEVYIYFSISYKLRRGNRMVLLLTSQRQVNRPRSSWDKFYLKKLIYLF